MAATSDSQEEGVVVVTGASRGIGRQVCINLLSTHQKLHVVAVGRSQSDLATLTHPWPERLHIVAGDIADSATQAQISALLQALALPVLAVVNNAATVTPTGPLLDTSAAEWTQMLSTNLTAALVLGATCIGALQESRGRIINVSSSASQGPVPGFSAYGMTKAALNYATRALALEYPEVTSVAFYPGVVNTAMNHAAIQAATAYAADPRTQPDTSALMAKLSEPIPVELPSAIIANLALRADASLSGRYVAYSDDEMRAYHGPPN
ncbi:hypothetical protein FBU31_004128 [Coemansia sp. 'formosensis']|nr:hypothetical protein FBU31_004128 [Coemansia sp. 'formosensis']